MANDPSSSRLRPHPRTRFAPSERKLDLDAALRQLLSEPHEAVDGHRQITIARHGHLTMVLFCFEAGSTLPDHVIDGQVTLHVLDGELEVTTDHATHHLDADQLLVLAPCVPHDVHAIRRSRLLLTVHLSHPVESERDDLS